MGALLGVDSDSTRYFWVKIWWVEEALVGIPFMIPHTNIPCLSFARSLSYNALICLTVKDGLWLYWYFFYSFLKVLAQFPYSYVIGSRGLHSSHRLGNFLSLSSKSPSDYQIQYITLWIIALNPLEGLMCKLHKLDHYFTTFVHLSSKFGIYMEGKSGRYILPRWDLLQYISCRPFIDHFWSKLFYKERGGQTHIQKRCANSKRLYGIELTSN